MSEAFMLGTADYAIVGIMLAISAGIGLYLRIFGDQQNTNEEYLFAGRNMPILPVAISLMATFMSATTLMGIPAEMYMFGTHMVFMNIGFILGPIIASYVFLPIYFDTGISTAYEYLERRFGRSTQKILSGIFLLQNIIFNGVVLYAPALALSAVTNLSVWTSVISVGIVCTFYCTVGGMKAVLWTDLFQALLMYICLFIIIVKGCVDLGGISNVFKGANDGGRLILPTFHLDFSTRYTMYSVLLQGLIITSNGYAGNQIQIQRQLTVKNLKSSQIANFLSIPMLVAFQLLCCICGLIFYVYFKTCDPITSPSKPIQLADQLMPYYIVSALSEFPGLPGFCIAGIFSASLSSISSAINSMAAVTYEDILRHVLPNHYSPVFITKIASVFYGALSILMSFIAASFGNLIKASIIAVGMVSGPSFGVFLLAALTTTTTEMGANLGIIVGFLFAGCATFIPNERYYPQLPVENNCSEPMVNIFNHSVLEDVYNSSQHPSLNYSTSLINMPINNTYPEDNFPISYMWISPISLLVCLIVGYCGSIIFTCINGKPNDVPQILLSPLRRVFLTTESSNE